MTASGYMTESQRLIQQTARTFAENVVLPTANRLDPERGDIPDDLILQMGELGFFGILIPEDLGGLGLGAFEYCLVAEELARGWMSVASLIARGNEFYRMIPAKSTAERLHLTKEMAAGRYLGAFAMSEPNAGSDIGSIACRARREGDDWVINGSKYWCTFADGADFITVVCRTDSADANRRHAGLVTISVPKPRGTLPDGVSGSAIPKIGYFGWRTWELHFDNVRVTEPVAGQGTSSAFYRIATGLETARAHTAARSIGLAQGAFDHAVAYARERQQFGRPISEFQAIRFKIATMATEIEAARRLLYFVCQEIDQGERRDKEAAMVKYFAAEMAERVTSEGMQILGGAGYTTLHPIERYWRDARLTKIFEGSSEIQQRIISDAILGKPTSATAP